MLLDWLKEKLGLIDYTQDDIVEKTLKELDFLDDVWIEDQSGKILKGWVFDINKKHIFVTIPIEDGYLDYRFVITRPLSQTKLNQNNLILHLNKPC